MSCSTPRKQTSDTTRRQIQEQKITQLTRTVTNIITGIYKRGKVGFFLRLKVDKHTNQ